MKSINSPKEAAEAKYEIERCLLGEQVWRLESDGSTLACFPPAHFELTVEWGKLILTWWDDEQAQSVRIVGHDVAPSRISLNVTRGMMRAPVTLALLRDSGARLGLREAPPGELSERRRWHARNLAEAIRRAMPGMAVKRVTAGPDPRHNVPGCYARLLLSRRGRAILAIGVEESESQATIDGVIAAGLIWLHSYNSGRSPEKQAESLWFCLPRNRSLTAMERIPLLSVAHLNSRLECFEMDEERGELTPLHPIAQTELLNAHPRELIWPASAVDLALAGGEWHRRIVALAPNLIEVRRRPGRDLIGYAIHGLEFARLDLSDNRQGQFGIAGDPARENECFTTLSERTFPVLRQLVGELVAGRASQASNRRHPYYRLRTEAWLESLLRRDILQLDCTLDPRHVYSQIPAWRGDERSVIDLLGVKRDGEDEGRLAVIEIKAAEDPQLPLQGLDYWLRVEQARARGEFGNRGLFPGVRLADRTPLLYLAAPRLRFHRTFAAIARCLNPEIEAFRVGLNANWREGVRAHVMERVNPPED